jgi:hypothetical protein
MNGKGDAPRNCFSEQYRDNYDRIFRTITSEDWRRALDRAKRSRNQVADEIRRRAAAAKRSA